MQHHDSIDSNARSKRFSRGFTLVELLFVVLLLGTVMTVIMACFEGGLRVYDRVSGVGPGELDAYLAGETLSRDLKNVIQSDQLFLNGDVQSLELLTVKTAGSMTGQRLQVRYAADGSGLIRFAATPEGEESPETVQTEQLLADDVVVRFRYHGQPDDSGAGGWEDSWTSRSNLPVAVQVEMAGSLFPEGKVYRTVLLETAEQGVAAP
jgi:prepilin-type N-terminal cleavage/methylation domain-containing protein